jgi:hypothetical protein
MIFQNNAKGSEILNSNIVQALIIVPSSDGNYKSYLTNATVLELKTAVKLMQNKKGNKSRIAACEREIRRKGKEPATAATVTSSAKNEC